MTQAKLAGNCGGFLGDSRTRPPALSAGLYPGGMRGGIAGRIFPAMLMAGGRETALRQAGFAREERA